MSFQDDIWKAVENLGEPNSVCPDHGTRTKCQCCGTFTCFPESASFQVEDSEEGLELQDDDTFAFPLVWEEGVFCHSCAEL